MKFIGRVLASLLALPILFLEWGWEPLSAFVAKLAKHPCWAMIEDKVRRLPRWWALCILFAPMIVLLPLNRYAIYLLGQGHAVESLALMLLAKVIGTASAARLFQLTLPALMTFSWFAYLYPIWKRWKDRCYVYIRGSFVWRAARRVKALAWMAKDGFKRRWKGYTI